MIVWYLPCVLDKGVIFLRCLRQGCGFSDAMKRSYYDRIKLNVSEIMGWCLSEIDYYKEFFLYIII